MSRIRRTVLSLERYIRAPVRWDVTGPVCALCTVDESDPQVLDEETLVEGSPGYEDGNGMIMKDSESDFCRVLGKHHGCEELRTFEFGSKTWGPSDLKKYMQRVRWFDPTDGVGQEGKLQL